jgi:WD40 repeat protein
MAFSPDGATLATGHFDGTLELWDSKTGALLDKYRVGDPVDSLAFSRDGTMLAVGDNEGIERLYDPATMRLLTPSMPVGEDGTFGVNRNDKAIASAVFSPDGATLATTDRDGTLRLWNTSSGASVGTMITPADGLAVLAAFSSDGRTLYSGSDGGQLESWPVAMFADPVAALCSAVGPPTQLDWTEYAPGQPFPAVCGGSP